MGVEQIDEAARERAEMHAALCGGGEELRAARRGVMQPIHGAVSTSGALVIDQVLDMRGILDLLAAIVAARVGGDDGIGVEDAHGIEGGTDLEAAPHVGVRDRVVVPVEADVGCLCPRTTMRSSLGNGLSGNASSRGRSSSKHSRTLRVRSSGHGRSAASPAAPGERLGIEVGDIGEAAGGEEAVANEADRALDPALSRCRGPPPPGAAGSDTKRRARAASGGSGSHRPSARAPRCEDCRTDRLAARP